MGGTLALASSSPSPARPTRRGVRADDVRTRGHVGAAVRVPIYVSEGVMAGVAIAVGLVLVVVGYRLLRVATALAAACGVFTIMYSLLSGVGVTDPNALLWTSVAVGSVAGVLVLWFFRVGLFLLGCVAGGCLAVWALSWSDVPFVRDVGWRWTVIIVTAVVCGVLALLFVRVIGVVATAWTGSFLVFLGLDVYAQTGFTQGVSEILNGRTAAVDLFSPAAYGMLVGAVALAVGGVVLQFTLTGKGDHHSAYMGSGGRRKSSSVAPLVEMAGGT
jgi:hypothetical protein